MTLHELNPIAFPKLDEDQIAKLGQWAPTKLMRYPDGTKLVSVGERDARFFVVESGAVEILDDTETTKTITFLGPGEFTGDVAHLTGGPSLVSAVARHDCEVYELSADAVREVLNQCPDLGDIILLAFMARRQILRDAAEFTGLRVIGSAYSKDTFRIRDFLAKNRVPHAWLDPETDQTVKTILEHFGVREDETPVVAWGCKMLLKNPSTIELAKALGIRRPLDRAAYDLVVVGAGPAGMAAAVYAASEGLSTVVLERSGPGGQAGRSMRIENYLGFPTGITGSDLADRAVIQAAKFGARVSIPTFVSSLTFENGHSVLHLDDGESVKARSMLIATGAEYRRLEAEGCQRFEGSGVYYAATPVEAPLCRGAEVVVVGGGNSAGQAAVFLAGIARKVYVVIRGDNLYKDMSSYLARRIEQTPNIEVLFNSEVREMDGDTHLREVEIVNKKTGEVRSLGTPALFSFIGAAPRTEWLPPEIEKDPKNFVRTGPFLAESSWWTLKRQPFMLETTRPGVFAAGDVRSGSVKRVASAVGEGAMAVMFVHEYLRESKDNG
jgi:thioredoxin reductase (NADPH)